MSRERGVVAAVAVVVSCIAGPVAAQNQVFNGSFARTLRGWTQETYVLWSPVDAGGASFSGSVLAVNTDYMNAHGVEQCVAGPAIVPGNTYAYGGKARIPAGQANTGFVGFGLRWHGGPACTGSPIDQPRAYASSVTGSAFAAVDATAVAPAGAVSAMFVAFATKNETGGVFTAYIDDLYFGPAGTTVAGPPEIFVPTGAHVVGYEGVNWRTDIEFHNPTEQLVNFRMDLLRRDQANFPTERIGDQVAAGASRRLVDTVYSNYGFQGAAALRIMPVSGTLAVTSRTYNLTANGTYGQFVPGIPDYEAVLYGEEARLVQLAHDLTTTTGYRTNIGFLNAVNMPITIEINLYDYSGTLLGTLTYPMQPYEFKQIDKIYRNVTADGVAEGHAVLRTTTPGGRFFAYASVIDNATGDPICVQPATY